MRLRMIRLAGFKSFVDPTTISLPGDLVGVVGPNGCGKSNVIDAVRWVMGEISAKHLRGGSMADVVFTGSSTRAPVSQASVELVFDNSEGRAGGRFAAFSEVSVKREVGRDAQSSYFLNGTRCRRRDVMDVFLGTGLGPRSYSIIEQGMISRVVEAKPEDLRDFLEEAAGISKYKERRRETENRIRHTVENLERLSDLREELGKRLTHLKRQATMAERYKTLKEEERELRVQLEALRWRALDEQASGHAERIGAQRNRLEAVISEQRTLERQLEHGRAGLSDATDGFNAVYRQVLDAGANVARSEEAIQNLRRRRDELGATEQRERERLQAAQAQAHSEEQRMLRLREELTRDEPKLEQLDGTSAKARAAFREAEEAYLDWQSEGEALSERVAEPARTKHAEEARIEHLQQNLQRMRERVQSLSAEIGASEVMHDYGRNLAVHEQALGQAHQALTAAQDALEQRNHARRALRETIRGEETTLHALRERYQRLRGRIASLEALQQAALGKDREALVVWLEGQGLAHAARLAEQLQVDDGFEVAVESMLGDRLHAITVAHLEQAALALKDLEAGGVSFFDNHPLPGATTRSDLVPLARHVRGAPVLESLLAGVYVAESLPEALSCRSRLAVGETVVTRDGVEVGPSWLRVPQREGAQSGVLARERTLKEQAAQLAEVEAELARANQQHEARQRELDVLEGEISSAQTELVALQQCRGEAQGALGELKANHEREQQRDAERRQRIQELNTRIAAEEQVLDGATERHQRSSEEMQRLAGERSEWERRRGVRRHAMEAARDHWHAVRDEAYELGLSVQAMRTQVSSLEEGRVRAAELISQLEQRVQEMSSEQRSLGEPLTEAEQALQRQLAERSEVERSMQVAREKVESEEAALKDLEHSRHAVEQRVSEQRERLEALQLEAQEVLVRRKTIEEALASRDTNAATVLATLDDDAHADAWSEKLEAIERRISRLGPINLAAIDEYDQESERKDYLDKQHADLDEALETLRSAIQKIDRETRARFKETYEKVNDGVKQLFPRLFGGGHAELQMTGDDLLTTGISVVARPPGKRNTSIHLLSGGEKALTAVALVFAIFGLNPAPFCLLDEVDAPLDDANVGRFCELVKEMSEQVQFVIVTHNKITMEIARQLIGVTMNEPGVSRLVAVDLDEAVQMAAA